MKKTLCIAALAVLTTLAALPALALPPDCDCVEYCTHPDLVCAVGFKVYRCRQVCFDEPVVAADATAAAELDRFLDELAAPATEPAPAPFALAR